MLSEVMGAARRATDSVAKTPVAQEEASSQERSPAASAPDATDKSDARDKLIQTVLWAILVVCLIMGFATLRATRLVALPLAGAIFVALLLMPIRDAIRRRVPASLSWLGVVGAALLMVVIALAVFGLLTWSGVLVVDQLEQHTEQLNSLRQSANQTYEEITGQPLPSSDAPLPPDLFRELLFGSWESLSTMLVIFFLAVLILLETEEWMSKTRMALDDHQVGSVTQAMNEVAAKVRIFLVIRTILGVISAVLAYIWLALFGVVLAPVWALLFFVLNYVPELGSIVAAIPPVLMALLQFGWESALLTAVGLFFLEQLVGNYVDPRLQGRSLGLSPAIILFSVIFWGWMWGPAGALLATPMTIAVSVSCAQSQTLRPVSVFLGRGNNQDDSDDDGKQAGAAAKSG